MNIPNPYIFSYFEKFYLLCAVLNMGGIDFSKYKESLTVNLEGVKQESIVNKGFKDLVLFAFQSRPHPSSRL